VFVLEYVAGLYDVEHGGIVWIVASQVEVTEWVRGVAMAVVRGREGRENARQDVEKEDDNKRLKRVKEQLLAYPNAVASLDDSKYFSDSDYEDPEVSERVRFSKPSKKVQLAFETPQRQHRRKVDISTSSTSTTAADAKYFSSSSSDYESDTMAEDHSFTSPFTLSSTSPASLRNSLTSHPNTAFLYHSQSHAANLNTAFAASKQARQVYPPNTAISTTEDEKEEDIWQTLSHTYARPDFYRTQPTLSNHSITNHPNDTIPLPSLLQFHQLISTLRTLHRDFFVLKCAATTGHTHDHANDYIITHVSSSLHRTPKDVQAAFGTSHAQTKQMMMAGLKRGGEMKVRVGWGVAGVERWVFLVPLVQGGGENGGRCWMGFLVEGEAGSELWE